MFASIQAYEWFLGTSMSLCGRTYDAALFAVAAFHALHVALGATSLLLVSGLALLAMATPVQSLAYELTT